jgi:hypothetical protein
MDGGDRGKDLGVYGSCLQKDAVSNHWIVLVLPLYSQLP